jgi:hypothetical protein
MRSELLYSEIFEQYQTLTDKKDQIAFLRKHDHRRFRDFLQLAFNKYIKFDVEIPQYRPAPEPAGLNFTYLDIEMSKMYRFVVGHVKRPQGLTPQKQKSLLLVVLESLHKDEAELLVKLIKKDLGIPTLTKKVVQEAFPDLDLG